MISVQSTWDTRDIAVGIIGVGRVGSQVAFGLVARGYPGRILLYDSDKNKAKGECLDLQAAAGVMGRDYNIVGASEGMPCCDIYVLSLGEPSGGKPREGLYEVNGGLCKEVFRKVSGINPEAVCVVLTNPSHRIAQDGLDYFQTVTPCGRLLDGARHALEITWGAHESLRTTSSYEETMACKGFTAYGPAMEAVVLVERYLNIFKYKGYNNEKESP